MKSSLSIIFLVLGFLAWGQKKPLTQEPLTEEAEMKAEMALIDGQKHLILENYAKALEMFQVAAEINPSSAAVHYKIAQILAQNESFNEALRSIERAIALDPTNKYYYLTAADIHFRRSDLGAAQRVYEELLKRPGNEEHLLDLALIFVYLGKDQKALETYTAAQNHFGTNESIVEAKQRIYQKQGNSVKIIEEWELLVKEEPWNPSHQYTLIDLLITYKETDKARQYLERLLDTNPNDGRAGLMLAEIMKNQGNVSGSLKHARAALINPEVDFELKGGILNDLLKTITPEEQTQYLALVKEVALVHKQSAVAQAFSGDVHFQMNDKEEALNFYRKSVRLKPDAYSVWQNILSLEAEFNQFDSLLVHAEKALELYPNQSAMYYFAGTAHLRKKNYRQATQVLEMGKRFAQDEKLKGAFWGQLGDAYNGLKDYPKSENAYNEALQINPSNEHVLNNYSYFLALRKVKLDKALEMSARLVELRPDTPTYLDTHGWVLFVQGDFKEARKYLQKAVELKPNASLLEHYGDVLFKLGDKEEALAQWQKAATLPGASENLLKKIADRTYYE